MRDEYDFSKAKRAKDVPHLAKLQAAMKGKTRITIMLDDDIIEAFRKKAEAQGTGYQTEINRVLRSYLSKGDETLERTLRRVIREELHAN
ncbi:MAG: BrnA antitoxin family protein [Gammaproteobacteria bacterium]|nr:BrnA antitoxin family protein [Gammaproteobacteria bacterium]